MEVLNQTLFDRLEMRFGRGKVDVVAPGMEIQWHVERRATLEEDKTYEKRKVDQSGEEYKVCCPFCNDTRGRLFINHMWGVPDEELGGRNLFLAQCFNETRCLDNSQMQKQLYEQVYMVGGRPPSRIHLRPGKTVATKVGPVSWPGPVTRLDVLMERHPHHRAIEYLESRFIDPVKLGKLYEVGYCAESRYHYASDRLIFPILMGGQLVGWQARYIGDSVLGVPFNKAKVPKYWSCPDMPRKLVAFNYDRAIQHPTIAIVEGPTDVYGFGVQALAVLGTTMSVELQKRFAADVKRNWGKKAVVLIILDPKQNAVSAAKGKPHHIKVLEMSLRAHLPHIVPVYLPDVESDPGSLDRDLLREICKDAAKKKRLTLDFNKPKKLHVDPSTLPKAPGRLHR